METKTKMVSVPATAGKAVAMAEVAKLSAETRNLIKSIALVSDLYDYVVSTYIQVFPYTEAIEDNTLDKFKDLCNQLRAEIRVLVGDVIDANMDVVDFPEV